MSDPTAVSVVRTRLADLTSATPVLETLNVRPSSLPDVFLTIERDHSLVSRITLGTPTLFREIGAINVVAHTRSGIGDTDAGVLAEEVRDLFHNYAVSHFQVLTVGSAVVFLPDEGNFFEVKVLVEYQLDFFK